MEACGPSSSNSLQLCRKKRSGKLQIKPGRPCCLLRLAFKSNGIFAHGGFAVFLRVYFLLSAVGSAHACHHSAFLFLVFLGYAMPIASQSSTPCPDLFVVLVPCHDLSAQSLEPVTSRCVVFGPLLFSPSLQHHPLGPPPCRPGPRVACESETPAPRAHGALDIQGQLQRSGLAKLESATTCHCESENALVKTQQLAARFFPACRAAT